MLPQGTNIMTTELCSCFDVYKLKDAVLKVALKDYNDKIERVKADGFDFGELERVVLLKTVDSKWMDHIDAMDALRRGIGLRGYGQRDPVIAYRQEGWDMFEDMVSRIHSETASILLKIHVEKREDGTTSSVRQNIAATQKSVRSDKKWAETTRVRAAAD